MENAGIPAYAVIAVLGGAIWLAWRLISLWREASDAVAPDDVELTD